MATKEELLALQARLNTGKNMSVDPALVPQPVIEEKPKSSIPFLFAGDSAVSPEAQARYEVERAELAQKELERKAADKAAGPGVLSSFIQKAIPNSPLAKSLAQENSVTDSVSIQQADLATPTIGVDRSDLATGPSQTDITNAQNEMQKARAAGRISAYGNTFTAEQKAIADQAKAGMDAATAASAIQEKLYEDQKALEAKQVQEQLDNQKVVQGKLDVLNTKLSELDKVTIDRDRFWKDKTTANKIVTGIGLFLGAFGSGGNRAATIVENAITQDINAQIADLNNKKSNTSQQMNIVQQMSQVFKNEAEVKAASRVFAYQNAQNLLQATANKYKSPQIQAQAAQGIAQLERAKQQAMIAFENSAVGSATSQAQDPITAKIYKMPEKRQKELLEAKEVYDSTQAAMKSIDESFAATKDIGVSGKMPFSDNKAVVEAENAKIESAIRATMKGQGTIQESEIERLVKPFLVLPLDTASQREIKKQKLKELLMTKNAGQINKLSSLGLIPKKQEFKSLKAN